MKLILLIILCHQLVFAKTPEEDDLARYTTGITELLVSGKIPAYLKDVAKFHKFKTSPSNFLEVSNFSKQSLCQLCDAALKTLTTLRRINFPEAFLRKSITTGCMELHLQTENVCKGLIPPMLDIALYIIDQKLNSTADKMCALLLGPTCHNQFDYFNWTINIPEKPSEIPKKIVKEKSDPIRILQLTDIHYDPNYTPGALAVCGEPICCQSDQGFPENSSEACGFWGDHRHSDTSPKLFNDTLRHIKTQKFDYVYFTGDIIPHRVWSTSRENNSKLEREIMDLLRSNLDAPVLFVLGNHESHPIDSFAPENIIEEDLSTKWLFKLLSDELNKSEFEGDFENIEKGGFYSVLLYEGFRVIVLNNIICYLNDLWLSYMDRDPYGELEWLTQTLLQSEKNGEYVHILYHVPVGQSDCLGTWTREFNRIINRFSDTISAQFNGHTHVDEFFLFFNDSNSFDAINVAFNGASLTPYSDNNPSYKIYEVDPKNMTVTDFEEWTFNLTAANEAPNKTTLDWYKLYSFKESYGLDSMEPIKIGQKVLEMAKNQTMLQLYNRYKYRMGFGSEAECDDDCNKNNLCRIVTTGLADTFHCEAIKNIYDSSKQQSVELC